MTISHQHFVIITIRTHHSSSTFLIKGKSNTYDKHHVNYKMKVMPWRIFCHKTHIRKSVVREIKNHKAFLPLDKWNILYATHVLVLYIDKWNIFCLQLVSWYIDSPNTDINITLHGHVTRYWPKGIDDTRFSRPILVIVAHFPTSIAQHAHT